MGTRYKIIARLIFILIKMLGRSLPEEIIYDLKVVATAISVMKDEE